MELLETEQEEGKPKDALPCGGTEGSRGMWQGLGVSQMDRIRAERKQEGG